MKKIIYQISLILLIITIGITSVFITQVNAGESIAGLNVSSAKEGENFTVSLILPQSVYGAECTITVTYSDNSKATERLVYVKGMESSFPNLVTFPAKVAGTTVVKATQIILTDDAVPSPNILEEDGTKTQTITIASNNPTPVPTPDPEPTTPTPDPSGTSSGNNGSSNNNNNNNNTNATTNNNTTKDPEVVNPTFKDVNETVYAINGCNVRSSCSTSNDSNKIGGLVAGQAVTRTGVENTWSRIEFNGKTAYVATRLLTTEKPAEEEQKNTVSENTVNNTVSNNTISNNTVENSIVDNTTVENNEVSEEQLLNQIEQEVGVLPEVGHNIATTVFIVISILSLIIIMRLQYKSKE